MGGPVAHDQVTVEQRRDRKEYGGVAWRRDGCLEGVQILTGRGDRQDLHQFTFDRAEASQAPLDCAA